MTFILLVQARDLTSQMLCMRSLLKEVEECISTIRRKILQKVKYHFSSYLYTLRISINMSCSKSSSYSVRMQRKLYFSCSIDGQSKLCKWINFVTQRRLLAGVRKWQTKNLETSFSWKEERTIRSPCRYARSTRQYNSKREWWLFCWNNISNDNEIG